MRPPESFIGQPVRSLQTMLRILAEDDNSLPTVVPDGIYGQTTMHAITEFQRQEGLPLTGVADQITWDRIAARYEPALVRIRKAEPIEVIIDPNQVFILGDESPYIILMQSMLIWLSKDHGHIPAPEATGIFDNGTQASLFSFQKTAGLPQTGQLDKNTWKHLSKHFTLNAHHNSTPNPIQADRYTP